MVELVEFSISGYMLFTAVVKDAAGVIFPGIRTGDNEKMQAGYRYIGP